VTSPLLASLVHYWAADVTECPELPQGGLVLAISLPFYMDWTPEGMERLSFTKTKHPSKNGLPPHAYSVKLTKSSAPPYTPFAKLGGTVALSTGAVTAVQSTDMLEAAQRLVRKRPAKTRAASAARLANGADGMDAEMGGGPPSSPSLDPPTHDERGGPTASLRLKLTVSSASPIPALNETMTFTSKYELADTMGDTPGERTPGRVVMLFGARDPIPVEEQFDQ